MKKRRKLFPGKTGNDSESSDDDVFYRYKHLLPICTIHIFQRAFGDEEAKDSSSSENSAEEEDAVQVKKSKGLNKIMDLPSVRPD